MFLSKFLISLALSSTVGSGLSQTVNVTSLSQSTTISTISNTQSNLNTVSPFNPDSFVHQYIAEGNIYYYFRNNAFPVSKPNTITNGYALRLSTQALDDMLSAFKLGNNGGMLSYITGSFDYYTRYTGKFVLSGKYREDAQKEEARMTNVSFAASKLPFSGFVTNALENQQGIMLFFYSKIHTAGINVTFYEKVEMLNCNTGATLISPYYHNIVKIN